MSTNVFSVYLVFFGCLLIFSGCLLVNSHPVDDSVDTGVLTGDIDYRDYNVSADVGHQIAPTDTQNPQPNASVISIESENFFKMMNELQNIVKRLVDKSKQKVVVQLSEGNYMEVNFVEREVREQFYDRVSVGVFCKNGRCYIDRSVVTPSPEENNIFLATFFNLEILIIITLVIVILLYTFIEFRGAITKNVFRNRSKQSYIFRYLPKGSKCQDCSTRIDRSTLICKNGEENTTFNCVH